ncbi:hypothetical protein C0Q70_01504 [Pomacea canaliculata]|uniref:Uncharacterized protein n=1 Tax=Pomacea canaliculata TaxID=400727 RepID=A0A2T7PZP0_POMCA|nr:hypothetical protein C0Q70_01504 [Pomacea canaliculata]
MNSTSHNSRATKPCDGCSHRRWPPPPDAKVRAREGLARTTAFDAAPHPPTPASRRSSSISWMEGGGRHDCVRVTVAASQRCLGYGYFRMRAGWNRLVQQGLTDKALFMEPQITCTWNNHGRQKSSERTLSVVAPTSVTPKIMHSTTVNEEQLSPACQLLQEKFRKSEFNTWMINVSSGDGACSPRGRLARSTSIGSIHFPPGGALHKVHSAGEVGALCGTVHAVGRRRSFQRHESKVLPSCLGPLRRGSMSGRTLQSNTTESVGFLRKCGLQVDRSGIKLSARTKKSGEENRLDNSQTISCCEDNKHPSQLEPSNGSLTSHPPKEDDGFDPQVLGDSKSLKLDIPSRSDESRENTCSTQAQRDHREPDMVINLAHPQKTQSASNPPEYKDEGRCVTLGIEQLGDARGLKSSGCEESKEKQTRLKNGYVRDLCITCENTEKLSGNTAGQFQEDIDQHVKTIEASDVYLNKTLPGSLKLTQTKHTYRTSESRAIEGHQDHGKGSDQEKAISSTVKHLHQELSTTIEDSFKEETKSASCQHVILSTAKQEKFADFMGLNSVQLSYTYPMFVPSLLASLVEDEHGFLCQSRHKTKVERGSASRHSHNDSNAENFVCEDDAGGTEDIPPAGSRQRTPSRVEFLLNNGLFKKHLSGRIEAVEQKLSRVRKLGLKKSFSSVDISLNDAERLNMIYEGPEKDCSDGNDERNSGHSTVAVLISPSLSSGRNFEEGLESRLDRESSDSSQSSFAFVDGHNMRHVMETPSQTKDLQVQEPPRSRHRLRIPSFEEFRKQRRSKSRSDTEFTGKVGEGEAWAGDVLSWSFPFDSFPEKYVLNPGTEKGTKTLFQIHKTVVKEVKRSPDLSHDDVEEVKFSLDISPDDQEGKRSRNTSPEYLDDSPASPTTSPESGNNSKDSSETSPDDGKQCKPTINKPDTHLGNLTGKRLQVRLEICGSDNKWGQQRDVSNCKLELSESVRQGQMEDGLISGPDLMKAGVGLLVRGGHRRSSDDGLAASSVTADIFTDGNQPDEHAELTRTAKQVSTWKGISL